MNIILGERCSGKTTELIKRSAETGAVIVAGTSTMGDHIKYMAKEMGLGIPQPISAKQLVNLIYGDGYGMECLVLEGIRKRGILIDEAQIVLQNIFAGCHIDEITMTDLGDNIEYLKSSRDREDRGMIIVTTDGDVKDDDLSSGLGKCFGYSDKPCPNCGRMRLEYWSCGKHICEKCHWCIEDNEYSKEHRM